MNILLLGAPGSGKGTASEKLIKFNGFTQLSTGDLYRAEISNKTELGLKAIEYINAGKYVPDEITIGMVAKFLEKKSDNLLFDGFPRTVGQAAGLDKLLESKGTKLDKVIHFVCDESVLIERLGNRMICPVCKKSYHKINIKPKVNGICDNDGTSLVVRPDDAPDKIKVRLEEYNTLTAPLINIYNNKMVEIDVTNVTPTELYEAVVEGLKL
ncbi:adenylate kinase [Spiroplasma sp. TIUS-1]|uniref:adenylate kinase family protein n=1 Tax=Spiroplasma sp. TIUS-1 TaxID=216963 RepID=UPI001397C068|nr:nucleoside monophosphate kinase [Spiroplasma sp. TIUS-1]QHX36162.1 adenylate kinase [Spiroplasma sp. TIUS-1]